MAGSRFRTTEGLNRAATATKAATSTFSKALRTGSMEGGSVVQIELDGVGALPITYTAQCRERATGALEIARQLDGDTGVIAAYADGGVLTVTVNNAQTGTLTYWVF